MPLSPALLAELDLMLGDEYVLLSSSPCVYVDAHGRLADGVRLQVILEGTYQSIVVPPHSDE